MIIASFGIIEDIGNIENIDYNIDEFDCVDIADDIYIDDWWDRLVLMKTYFHTLNRPEYGLARWGITLIPPESLRVFQDIVISDKRVHNDDNLQKLANKIQEAIDRQKFMIHFGV